MTLSNIRIEVSPVLALGVSSVAMSLWALIEITIGNNFSITTITNDGKNMLAHTASLLLAFIVSFFSERYSNSRNLEYLSKGGLVLIIGYLLWTARGIAMPILSPEMGVASHHHSHHGHHHAPITGGVLLMVIGITSFVVHAGVSTLLSMATQTTGGRCQSGFLAKGCCAYMLSHTLMIGAMIVGGGLKAFGIGNSWIDPALNLAIAILMVGNAIFIGWRLISKKSKNSCNC